MKSQVLPSNITSTSSVSVELHPEIMQLRRLEAAHDAGRGGAADFLNPATASNARPGLTALRSGMVLLASAALPANSRFVLPTANACQSSYDQYYGSEPGVYAYWAFCEAGANPLLHDYVGEYDFDSTHSAWGNGTLTGGVAGPVSDGETALETAVGSNGSKTAQNLPLNKNAGTIALWLNSKTIPANGYLTVPFSVSAYGGHSSVSTMVTASSGKLCFGGAFQNTTSTSFSSTANGNISDPQAKCGFVANTWHRVVLTWAGSQFVIYIDGVIADSKTYVGTLDNLIYLYQLFPVNSGITVDIAKITISNQAWSSAQVALDYLPNNPTLTDGGVHVGSQYLGTIHRDVLGVADNNADLSSSASVSALTQGLQAAGVTSVRYANGFGGSSADLEDWHGSSVSCTSTPGTTNTAQNISSKNNLDSYLPNVAQTLNLHIGFTVNYGTNPPLCNGPGDPIQNGANLVTYANKTKNYGIKYWEIGNEQYSPTTEADFHSSPNTGASYALNEPAFYSSMKAVDPSILIGVPIGLGNYNWLSTYTLPVLMGASYDAVVWHNYPIHGNAVSDGTTPYMDRIAGGMSRPRSELLTMQTLLLNAGKSPDAIWVTEWNADRNGGGPWSRQTMGPIMPMFATIELAEYMRAGVQYATWWTQGMSASCNTLYYDTSGTSAYSWWDCGGLPLTYPGKLWGETSVGLNPGDITPVARAFQLLSQSGFATEGEHMLQTSVDSQNSPWLVSYGATHGKSYAVILINRDRDNSHTVPVTLPNMSSGTSVQQWTYGRAQYDATQSGNWAVGPTYTVQGAWSGSFNAVLPPWSVSVLIF
jgi:hypothetical protein